MFPLRLPAGLIVCALGVTVQALGGQLLSIAHRGGSLYAPENTLAAFSNSLPVTHLMETDAQITSDGFTLNGTDLFVASTTEAATQNLGDVSLAATGTVTSSTSASASRR